MRKNILLFALLAVFAVGCNNKKAFNFSEDIVKKEKELEPLIQKTENEIGTVAQAGEFSKVATLGADMEKQIDTKITEIKAMSTSGIKKGDELKAAAVKYFEAMKSVYTGYRKFGEAPTEEARNAELQKILSIASDKNAWVMEIQTAQKDFADANGFKIEPAKP